MSKKVLLVCYEFPPNTGIGGRKWAFLAKYLVREDIELHVLTKENKNLEDFAWGLDLHEVKKHFLEIISTYTSFHEQMKRNSDIVETADILGGVVEAAKTLTLKEAGDWFDKVTVKRNMN